MLFEKKLEIELLNIEYLELNEQLVRISLNPFVRRYKFLQI